MAEQVGSPRPDGVPRCGDDARWAAVLSRDPAADGRFFYGVKSTGIYCRPTCPSRRPKRSNVVFLETAEQAEREGFRPCLRCRPGEASPRQLSERTVASVRHLLDTMEPAPTLAQLGEAVGLSPYHLQRLFKRVTGLSPKDYAAARRAERLKAGLRRGESVTSALYDAGYGSARALYDRAGERLGMSPGAYRRGGEGMTIRFTVERTPLGLMLLAATPKGICALRFGDAGRFRDGDRFGGGERLVAELRDEFPRATLVEDPGEPGGLERYVHAVLAYLQGEFHRLDLPLDVASTDFRQKVWGALQAIPYGETRSYGDVAEAIDNPKAARAVARACAANPVALVVPCHRVVRAGGQVGGYRWGVDRKRGLLDQEKLRSKQTAVSRVEKHPARPAGLEDELA